MATTAELLAAPHYDAFKAIVQEQLKDGVSVEMYSIGQPSTLEMGVKGALTSVTMGLHPSLADVTLWAYMGDVEFNYYRPRAQTFFSNKDLAFTVDFPIYIHQIMDLVERRHRVVISPDEYEDILLTENEEGAYTIAFMPESYRFVGEMTFTTTIRVKPLEEVILVKDMGQLSYPEDTAEEVGVLTKLLGLVNDLNVTRLDPHLLTSEWVAWRDFEPLENGAARFTLRTKMGIPTNRYYSGEVFIDYIRRDIGLCFDGPYIPITSDAQTLDELIDELSQQTGVYMLGLDFEWIELPTETGVHYITLIVSEQSEHYYGNKTIELTRV